MLDTEKSSLLDKPLDMSQIKHREGGGGKQLAYISGKFAMDQANRIFGYGKWGYKVVNRGQMTIDEPNGNKVIMYTADVELWVTGADFTFPGAGVGIVGKPFTVAMHEKAYKEAETDAMKRALRHYGDQFGLCLYDGDDYVDAGNGQMVQVKNVPVQRKAQAPRPLPSVPNSTNTETITPQQIASVRKLCQHLNREVPDALEQKSFLVAKRLIEQMSGEYRELYANGAPSSIVNSPDPADLRKRCAQLSINIDHLVMKVLKSNVPEDNWTPEDCGKLQRALNIVEENRSKKVS